MRLEAHAKINLSLDIVGKREDGYHLLSMVMQSMELHDIVELLPLPEGIMLECDKEYVPLDERNIAYKAARLIQETYGVKEGVKIRITKRIPVAAGLAGGSADAAAVLKGMNTLFSLGLSEEELMALGLKIGADVPFCLRGGTCLCEGIGEKVTSLKPFKDWIVLLVKPPFGVSTKDAYGSFDLSLIKKHVETDKLIAAMENDDLKNMGYAMRNLLENVVLRKHPMLKNLKQTLLRYGAEVSLMSGSGPTVYGIFTDPQAAQNAAKALDKNGNEVILTHTIA
jgi:4-diphosphocytidyl-2-C-methyl-D-erythritol kinase